MSRIGKKPIALPSGVEVSLSDEWITVKGPLGSMTQKLSCLIKVICEGSVLRFELASPSLKARKMWGTMRALVANMVKGVTQGFQKKLMLVGVGFRAQVQEDKLNLFLGFSHPIVYPIPFNVGIKTPTVNEIIFESIDKQLVGEHAARVRRYRRWERYKGKGLRYADELVVLKETTKK